MDNDGVSHERSISAASDGRPSEDDLDERSEDYEPEGDMAYASEGETLTDGELSGAEELPPRQERYIRAVRRALRRTLRDLCSLELEVVGDRLKKSFSEKRASLSKLVDGVQNSKVAKLARIPSVVRDELGVATATQRRRIGKVLRERRHKLQTQLAAVDTQVRRAQHRVQTRVRKVLSGDPAMRVRDYLAVQRKKPMVIRLLDKTAFCVGVLSLCCSEFVLLRSPESFWLWYTVLMASLLVARYPSYKFKKMQYFMLDFCYFANLTLMLQVVFFPSSCAFFKVNFAFAVGPLSWAVVLWRNSLVFHDIDKVTTVYIHILPSWVVFATRFYTEGTSGRVAALATCGAWNVTDFYRSVLMYMLWQALYFLKTEVMDTKVLNADPKLMTSLRWLAVDSSRGIHKLVLFLMRKWRFFGRDETFDARALKTKLIFMASQLVYTAITLLPTALIYCNIWVTGVYVTAIFGTSVYNGGEYYIEIFSRRYYRQFEDRADGARVRDPDLEVHADGDGDVSGSSGATAGAGPEGEGAVQDAFGEDRQRPPSRRRRANGATRAAPPKVVCDVPVLSGTASWGEAPGTPGQALEPPPIVSDDEDEDVVEFFMDVMEDEDATSAALVADITDAVVSDLLDDCANDDQSSRLATTGGSSSSSSSSSIEADETGTLGGETKKQK